MNKRALNYFGSEKVPLYPTTFSIAPTRSKNIVLSFAWVPPEKPSDFHILTRMSMPNEMAKSLAEELLKTIEYVEGSKPVSEEKGAKKRKRSS